MTDRLAGTLDEGTASPQPAVPSPSVPGRTDGLLRARSTSEQAAEDAQLSLIPSRRGAYNEAAA